MKSDYSETIKVGFQGVRGSFSEEALFAYFGEDITTYAVDTFEEIFQSLIYNQIDFGVLPIENSSTGAIAQVYDLLNQYESFIIGEICLPIRHHLLGLKGAFIGDINEVYSHSQGFEQSSEFLKQYPDWKLIPYYNTAMSAELVQKKNLKYIGAIASEKAARIYGLKVLATDINSNSDNTTRFIIIGKNMKLEKESDKISIIVSTLHKAGHLYNILRYFAKHNINMLKIESRPIKDKPWEYFFYIDFEGNLSDPLIKSAIKSMEQDSTYFKILGNYKSHLEHSEGF